MRPWGIHDAEKPARQQLKEYVLSFLASDQIRLERLRNPFDSCLRRGSAFSGEPYWEIDHIAVEGGGDSFRLYADEKYSGTMPEEDFYSVDEVFSGLEEALVAVARKGPYVFAPRKEHLEYAVRCEKAIQSLPMFRARFR